MIKSITKEITVTEPRVIGKQIYCDECKKLIVDTTNAQPRCRVQYWEVTTGHYDWGNDSCDSVEEHQYCSKECITEAFEQYLEETCGNFNTEYFEVHNCRA